MEKTKLGISVGLLSAIAFLCGYLQFTMAAVVCGYILIREENEDVRRNALYAIFLSGVIILLNLVVSTCGNFLDVFDINNWMYDVGFFRVIRTILSFLKDVIDFVDKVAFGLLTVLSLAGVKVKFAFLDKFLEK